MQENTAEARRGHRVVVTFSDREYAQVKRGAEDLGLRVSSYVRVASLQGNQRLKKVMAEYFDSLKSKIGVIEATVGQQEEDGSGREDT